MPALPLTPEQLADAARLKGLFEQWKVRRKDEGQPSSQMVLGHLLEMNQSAISQYLNGGIPLNTAVAAKFAKVFGCQIDDFSPVLAKEAMGIGEAVTSLMGEGAGQHSLDLTSLSKLEMQLVLMYRELPDAFRDEVLQLTNKLHTQAKPVKSAANPYPGAPLPATSPAPSPGTSKPGKRAKNKSRDFLSS